eukprot:TRINITY_DN9532_c0_g1_i1.p1 TRINITY_DN9532_c0_g1~~TRINITY_DN9532_c0_g1_i1.p1  ORF type:complete len:101 (+),score=14.93 TRINITY_DN9532_c0_g1_i1:75-377(+)
MCIRDRSKYLSLSAHDNPQLPMYTGLGRQSRHTRAQVMTGAWRLERCCTSDYLVGGHDFLMGCTPCTLMEIECLLMAGPGLGGGAGHLERQLEHCGLAAH